MLTMEATTAPYLETLFQKELVQHHPMRLK